MSEKVASTNLKFNLERFQEAATDLDQLRKVPKADLHSHSLLACRCDVYKKLLGEAYILPGEFGSLKIFLEWVGKTIAPVAENPVLLRETLKSAISVIEDDGVTHAELSIHLPMARLSKKSWVSIAEEINSIRKQSTASIKFELGIPRPISDELLNTEALAALETGVFSGIDIYDDELACTLERFLPVIKAARRLGHYVKIHTGEVGAPERIWNDLKIAEPDAIQHGVRIAEDKELMKYVEGLNIPLHICPTSNVKLGVVQSLKQHPMRALFDARIPITVNTDDYFPFGSSVSEEFLKLFQCGLFSAEELETIRIYGLNAATSGTAKKAL